MNFIDIHSHILPALDDGARTTEQAVNMLKLAEEQGIRHIIATPHNMPGKGCPPYTVVQEKVNRLQKICEEEGIGIQIGVGTEYFFREEVLELLEKEEIISLNGSEYVLVEFDPSVEKRYFRNALRNVLANGYRPVIAHIERYVNIVNDLIFVDEVKKMGALIQVNAASVVGENGRQSKTLVKKLLKEHLVDFVATDAHSDGRRGPYMQKCGILLQKKYGSEYANKLLFQNAIERIGINNG